MHLRRHFEHSGFVVVFAIQFLKWHGKTGIAMKATSFYFYDGIEQEALSGGGDILLIPFRAKCVLMHFA